MTAPGLSVSTLTAIQHAVADARLDGWLLYEFHGANPVAAGLIGLEGLVTRRAFVWIPREGIPVALTHAIEQSPWRAWPAGWEKVTYSGWRSLEGALAKLVAGKRVAMEYSPGDAVPYLDRVPAGVLEMVRAAGATVESSADLVSRFYAVWNDLQLASHRRAAARIAAIAVEAIRLAATRAESVPMTEYQLACWIRDRFGESNLATDHGPIVAIGPNAADPHYEPVANASAQIGRGCVLLVDLWARENDGVYADQTWMASLGTPAERDLRVWNAVRDARDAALSFIRDRVERGERVLGAEADDVARATIERHGFGDSFIHRTGHSIDPRDLHGAGPNIDNLETREDRALIRGVGFSIEPGVYLTNELGVRSEVNAFVGDRELVVTPAQPQTELLVV